MNSKRISYVQPKNHKIIINPFWLLGFIEGEGSFGVIKKAFNNILFYNKILLKAVIEKISDYLFDLIPYDLEQIKKKKKIKN